MKKRKKLLVSDNETDEEKTEGESGSSLEEDNDDTDLDHDFIFFLLATETLCQSTACGSPPPQIK